MKLMPTVEQVVAMLRDEGIVEIGEHFAADGSLFEAGMDSMAVMHLIVVVEERFGAVIGPEDAGRENLETPEALARLIGRRLA